MAEKVNKYRTRNIQKSEKGYVSTQESKSGQKNFFCDNRFIQEENNKNCGVKVMKSVSAHESVIKMHNILHKDNVTNTFDRAQAQGNAVRSANRV